MLKFEFILPIIYGLITSITILKFKLFDLKMNTMIWIVYFANIFTTYILYKVGEVIDKCLER